MRICTALAIGISFVATPASAGDAECGTIRAVIRKMNEVKRARSVNRWLNDAFNNFGNEEVILTEWAEYSRWESGPWRIKKRAFTPLDAVANCEHLRDESVNGVSTSLYVYDQQDLDAKRQVRMWIDRATGLPLQSQLITMVPRNFEERYITYTFASEIQLPI